MRSAVELIIKQVIVVKMSIAVSSVIKSVIFEQIVEVNHPIAVVKVKVKVNVIIVRSITAVIVIRMLVLVKIVVSRPTR